jgi:hypothetical protein
MAQGDVSNDYIWGIYLASFLFPNRAVYNRFDILKLEFTPFLFVFQAHIIIVSHYFKSIAEK